VAPNGNIFASNIYEGILRSTDKGESWEIKSDGISSLEVLPVKVDSRGFIFTSTYKEGIYVSKDDGESWIDITGNMATVEVRDIIFDQDDNLYLATYESVWKANADQVPVELLSFTAAISGSGVELKWTTATETNNRGFEIERKQENSDWITRGFIPVQAPLQSRRNTLIPMKMYQQVNIITV
jgi:hypothetical protein